MKAMMVLAAYLRLDYIEIVCPMMGIAAVVRFNNLKIKIITFFKMNFKYFFLISASLTSSSRQSESSFYGRSPLESRISRQVSAMMIRTTPPDMARPLATSTPATPINTRSRLLHSDNETSRGKKPRKRIVMSDVESSPELPTLRGSSKTFAKKGDIFGINNSTNYKNLLFHF